MMEILQIPIQEISMDESFRFARHDPSKISQIESSVRLNGLMDPIWVRASSERLLILAGFSRFEAVKAAGLSVIPIRVVSPDESLADVFYQILLIHRISSEFTLIEKARILKIIRGFDPIDGQLRGRYLTLMELPEKQTVLDEIEELLTLDPEIRSYIEMYGLALKQASRFLMLDAEEQRFCAELGEALFIRPVELLEIISPLREIARRDGLSFPNATHNLGIPDLLKTDATRGQKIGVIKQRILERRFPKLTEWNRLIESSARSMGLLENVRLRWDKTLETPGVQIQATMRSAQEVRDLAKVLASPKTEKELNALFEIVS